MANFFFLTSLLLGWALGCGSMYALLRWVSTHFAPGVRCAGGWALATWVPVYMSVGMGGSSSWHYQEEPYPVRLALAILAAAVGNFLVGSMLLRFVPNRSERWWHDVLFCALYFGCAFAWGEFLLVCWPMKSGPLYEIAQWNGQVWDAHWLMLCVWLFPLGAPIAEIVLRNFQQVFVANRDGRFE